MPKNIQQDHVVEASEVYSVEEMLELVQEGMEQLDVEKIRRTPAYDIASFLNRLDVEQSRALLRRVPIIHATAILEEMDVDEAAEVVASMREWRAIKILEEFELDDAADVIAELEEPDRLRLLSKLPSETARSVRSLLKYAPDTAGGVMTPNFISVYPDMTVDEAIQHIRKTRDDASHMSYIYVTDRVRKLRGVFSMKALILASPGDKVSDFMETDLKGVCNTNEDKEKIALAMAELNLFDLPVVDAQGRLLGIVEHDDVIDIIQSEATEDFQKLVGAGGDEAIHDDLTYSLRRRSPWLFVNLLTAIAGALVISLFEDKIAEFTLLAVFMPAIASLGGNTGAQTLAVAIRSIAVGEVETIDSLGIYIKEGLKGLLSGLFVGVIASVSVYLITDGSMQMSFIVFLAMTLNMALGGIAGAFIPLMLKRYGFDPAQSSSIFLTGTTDICGFFIFLSLGSWLLF